jgi:Tol biopolymer transport system component/DNA-binding winged helix-turn-helix (wHTH) protein
LDPPDIGAKIFRFGAFELNSQTGELRKHGVRVRLPDQSCRILIALLQRPGHLVSREELRQQVWPEGTFVDWDHGLNLAVARLRQALGDTAERPKYVETLPRKGYRFRFQEEAAAGQTQSVQVTPDQECTQRRPAPGRFGWRRPAAFALAAGITIVIFWVQYTARPPALLAAAPLTSYVGVQRSPSFSPEGDRVAFSWNGEKQDNFDIYVKQIGVEAPLRLTTNPGKDLSPAWSPDGLTIAFVRLSGDATGKVLVVSSLPGGPERRLSEITAPLDIFYAFKFLAWSPDGKWLVVSDGRSSETDRGLFLLSVDTGEKRRLTQPPGGYDDFDPVFSPDGAQLAFVRHTGSAGGDIYVLELDRGRQPQGESRRLTFDNRPTSSPVWTHDGRALLFARYSLSGRQSLWKVTPSSSPRVEPLPISADNASGLAISPNGDRLIYTSDNPNVNIWAVDLPDVRFAKNPTSIPRLLMASNRRDNTPSFSPDGQQIAFHSTRSGWPEVWAADRDGSHARQLTNLRAPIAGFPRWSPDGRRIVFHSRPKGPATLFLLDLPAGGPRQINYPAIDDFTPSWSHDGKWIYFGSTRTGVSEVWRVATEGGPVTQLTHNGGNYPLESADARFLFYTKTDNGIWRIPLSGGPEEQVISDPVDGAASAYAPIRNGIYFIPKANQAGRWVLAFFSFATRQSREIVEIHRPVGVGLAVSPDERMLLYVQQDKQDSDLMLVENFH